MNSKYEWQVPVSEASVTLALFLKNNIPNHSYSARAIKRFIDAGCCQINGKIEKFHHTKLRTSDIVNIRIPQKEGIKTAPFSKERCLYEDAELLVYNKPAGLVCDDAAAKQYFAPYGRIFLVHRLDKETTGALLLAKTPAMRDTMMEAFRARTVRKHYVAIVTGVLTIHESGRIENYLFPVSRFQGQTLWGCSTSKGQYACTDWVCTKHGNGASLVSLQPHTGRTHQLRVHMKALHHPIIGDRLYNTKNASTTGLMLHAEQIIFEHPSNGKSISCQAPLPAEFLEGMVAFNL